MKRGQDSEDESQAGPSILEQGSALVLRAGAALVRRLPQGIRRGLDDRLFSVIFQVTRVTNDHYGWRPEEAGEQGDRSGQ